MTFVAPTRRALIALGAGAAALPAVRAWADPDPFPLTGRTQQGGTLIGRTVPRGLVALDGQTVGQASAKGLFVVGFDRDEPAQASVAALAGRDWRQRQIVVTRGDFDIQRIDGLPENLVTPTDPALIERIKREAALKAQAFASRDESDGFRDGFIMPLEAARVSARWGGQRILNGKPMQPHYGLDLAAPVGTPIHAPAPGLVVLAEPDLHYDGGLTLIDHGQGLISCYLHQSRQTVRAGERVVRGQLIGEVGQTGRATGPHLCWRMKWRTRNLDPSLLVGVSAPEKIA